MMKIKSILFIIVFFISTNVFSQSNLDNYKYIIVPKGYEFLRGPNQYRLNELTQFLFNKVGFNAILDEKIPEDLYRNSCLALNANVVKESGLFATKLKIILKDCKDQTVFESRIGTTREKDLTKAYHIALREAFTSFDNVNYKYVPREDHPIEEKIVAVNNSEEVKRLQEEVKALQAEKVKQLKELEEAKIAAERQKIEEGQKAEALRQEKEREIAVQKEAAQKERERLAALQEEKLKKTQDAIQEADNLAILYAQPIENGFQLVDNTPKVVMILIETGRKDTFIVKDQNATVYKEDGFWFISKTENNKPVTEKINIKF